MNTWMIYGPFDLSNAKSAQISFMLWRHIEINFDALFFGVSGDRNTFDGWDWDGDVSWESISIGLDNYLGDSDVWIAWQFKSDGSIQYDGPWIDDIVLDFEPGDVTVQGRFTYADRSSIMQGAKGIKVQLWDRDTNGGDDLLAETIVTEGNGHYSFLTLQNWDTDDTDPILGNRRLDLYVLWVLENDGYKVTNSSGTQYAWISSTYSDTNMGSMTISGSLPPLWTKYQAMWIFQDIGHAREYYLSHTNPQSDPGFLTAHWEENQNSENGIPGSHFWALINPHVYIAQSSLISADTIVHELGHHVMWNKTGQWLWYEFNCFDHDVFSQESGQCAWSEGWADFFAITVNGDVCYDKGVGPCTGVPDQDKYDLESHTRNDPNAEGSWWGDNVEGRVAGTLYDLMDSTNESPWYDNASWGFDPVNDIALAGSGRSNLQQFWTGYAGLDKHNGVRSIYQNTIDYDQAPVFSAIPEQRILQNFPRAHLLDLWNYSSDAESPDTSLTYSIVGVTDTSCGVSLDSHWVNANPQLNWVGSCYVTVRANDSIKIATIGFWMHVLQINSRIFLPVIMNDRTQKEAHLMKRFFWFPVLLIVILVACSSSSSGAECKEGICVSIEVEGPVQALEPARFIISVKTEKDISELPIGLSVFPGVSISDIEKIPENASLVYQDKTMLDWQMNTKGGQEYFFSGYVTLSKPPASYGIFSYSVLAFFTQPTFGRVSDSVTIYLDAEGNQVENSKAILEMQTDWPAPTPPPDLTIIPPTPWPTIVWPTETPLPTVTPPGYPAPGEEGAAGQQILPTLPGYPNP